MDLAQMQAAASSRTERNLRIIDIATDDAISRHSAGWSRVAAQVEIGGWSSSSALALGEVTLRAAKTFTRDAFGLARKHALSELRAISREAAGIAATTRFPALDDRPLVDLAMAMADRVAAVVGAAEHHSAAILGEVYQGDRIVETEGFRVYNEARAIIGRTLAAAGDGKTFRIPTELPERRDWVPAIVIQWDATLDRRTCPTCRSLAGKLRLLGSYFEGLPDPPVHPRCRCALAYWPLAVPI